MKRSATVGDVVVYAWDDETSTGFVGVRVESRVVFPCDAGAAPTGAMSLCADEGEVVGDDPELDEGRFVRIALPLLKEWTQGGALPAKVTRTYW
jgi:hypothetical protein